MQFKLKYWPLRQAAEITLNTSMGFSFTSITLKTEFCLDGFHVFGNEEGE